MLGVIKTLGKEIFEAVVASELELGVYDRLVLTRLDQ